MRNIPTLILCGFLLTTVKIGIASAEESKHHSAYSGQQHRAIKSLSEEDISDLKNGAGWGLAKAAELNGVPGPMHLLEMKDEISLTDVQIESIEQVFNEMRTAAKDLGTKLIDQERLLGSRFRDNVPTTQELRLLLEDIGTTRSALRFVHLSAHLKMPGILSPDQIDKYNQIRGYSEQDPCSNIPQGHDVNMWKKHNNCG